MATNSVTGASITMRSHLPRLNRRLVWFPIPSCFPYVLITIAKPETVEKVCKIVKQQLALPDDSNVSGESKFSALGADSLDMVEIVMGLEEEAVDLIEEIIKKESLA